MTRNIFSPSFIVILFFLLCVTTSCENPRKGSQKKYSLEQINTGKALVAQGKCGFCHTPVIDNSSAPPKLLSGHPSDYELPDIPNTPVGSQQWMEFMANLDSTVWVNEEGLVYSANITPDEETGIGLWTEEMFINTMRTGKHPGWKRELRKPMPWLELSTLTNEQLTAIYAYLMSIEPVDNRVPDPIRIK